MGGGLTLLRVEEGARNWPLVEAANLSHMELFSLLLNLIISLRYMRGSIPRGSVDLASAVTTIPKYCGSL